MKKTLRGKTLLMLSAAVAFLSMAEPAVSRAYVQTTGVITANAAKVRKEPSTGSDMMVSLLKGSSVLIIDEVKDSAGAVWYKVSYENSTGYIRSDLMLKATAATTAGSATTGAEAASQPAATQVTAIAETKAYVNYKSVRVRQGASAQHEIVGSAVENTPVVITGEAKASDGKKWYQVRYTNQSGREVVGFVRSDLLTLGDPPAPPVVETPAEPPAEQPENNGGGDNAENPEENGENGENNGEDTGNGEGQQVQEEPPAPEETSKPDYEMAYLPNKDGVEEWFLLDNIEGTKQALENLRAAAAAGEKLSQASGKQSSTQKIILFVLGALVVVLAIVIAVLLFKIKDMYDDYDEEEEDEEEEDEDEEEEEEVRIVRRRRPVVNMEEKPQKQAPAAKTAARAAKQTSAAERKPVPVKKVEYDLEGEEFEAGQAVVPKQQPKRKAKNFLIEDDEFEFEFLNMDERK